MAPATMTMPIETPAGDSAAPGEDNSQLWLERLNASGPRREAAVVELHALLLKAARSTWAYKFALLEASVKVRRRAWQGREVPIVEDAWAVLADTAGSTGAHLEGCPACAEDFRNLKALLLESE